ncbi:AAA domain-containing protein [Streptomyces tendae]|uniref:AAA domain-containing protein n=1 Tax=Streptomyces tendae TaxID=1932 RepID=A0A6B3QHV7_STRTE|nr:AAA domain-containing protein [Streptomyces tendae]
MPSITTVVAQALHAAATALRRNALQDGMVFGELWERVLAENPGLRDAWAQAEHDSPPLTDARFKNYVNRNASSLVRAGWLYRAQRRWQLTGIGADALDRLPDPVDFSLEAGRRYRKWERQQHEVSLAVTALEQLPDSGSWVVLEEVAAEFGVDPDVLGTVLRGTRPPGWYLVLGEDGRAGAGLPLLPHERDQWQALLGEEGVLDTGRSSLDTVRARPDRWMPAREALGAVKQPLGLAETADDEETPRQLWIIRGVDAVTGVPLVRGPWRDDSMVTLDPGFPPPTAGVHDLESIRRAVETALPATATARREAVARELDAFLHRMRKGDIVLSTDGFETYVGVVGGPATHRAERLARPVDWRNLHKPLDFLKDLPSGLSSVVQDADSQVLEATEYAETVLALIGDMPRTAQLPTGPAVLPDATDELAEALHMPDTSWLQDCVELLRATPQLIFHGPPGTGKTYTALALARHLAGASSATNVRLVQFHPAYAYEDFFEGIRPRLGGGQDGATGGGLAYDLVRGPLRKLADEAERRPAEVFVLVVDEINRGHLAKIFGELYFLLEYRNERVHLLYGSDDGRGFRLPPNLYLLGTMNTVDRSVAYMDAAMRRRFSFMELHPDTQPVSGVLDSWLSKQAEERGEDPDSYDDSHARLLDEINRLIADGSPGDRSFRVGPSYFMQDLAHAGDGALERLWKTQIIPLLTEHHWGDGTDVEFTYGLDKLREQLGIMPPPDETSGSEDA